MSKDLKDKSIKELEKMLAESREALRKFRFALSGSKTRDLKEGRSHRKKIAQILTELKNKHE
jgi:ribosomal protein L29